MVIVIIITARRVIKSQTLAKVCRRHCAAANAVETVSRTMRSVIIRVFKTRHCHISCNNNNIRVRGNVYHGRRRRRRAGRRTRIRETDVWRTKTTKNYVFYFALCKRTTTIIMIKITTLRRCYEDSVQIDRERERETDWGVVGSVRFAGAWWTMVVMFFYRFQKVRRGGIANGIPSAANVWKKHDFGSCRDFERTRSHRKTREPFSPTAAVFRFPPRIVLTEISRLFSSNTPDGVVVSIESRTVLW